MELFKEPVLTDYAVYFLYNHSKSISSKDFKGFLLFLKKKYNAVLFVSLEGKIVVCLLNEREITPRKYRSIYRYLRKTNFIREGCYDPFPEIEAYSNLKLNEDNMILIDECIFQ